jgi:hypothetical protein
MVSVEVEGDEIYDGIPVSELRLDSVEWSPEQVDHIRTRSKRYPGALDLEPEWATEAALDPKARIGRDSASKTGEGIRVTGWSGGARRVLTVILLPAAHPPDGLWLGATAWTTKGRDLREYEEEEE